jgi:MFS family permease
MKDGTVTHGTMKRRVMPVAAGSLLVVALAAAAAAWRPDARALLAGYLALWWFGAGALLGGLANVWLHQLTGGAWGETIRPPLLRAARWLPLACVLFLPVLAGMHLLYPWAGGQALEPDTPFRRWWFTPGLFMIRSVAYLALWSFLSWIETRARHGGRPDAPPPACWSTASRSAWPPRTGSCRCSRHGIRACSAGWPPPDRCSPGWRWRCC